MKKGASALLAALAKTRNLSEALDLVPSLERDHGFKWRAVGNRENNYGSINIGSDPGHALVERVTNAIDAVIEHQALTRTRRGKAKGMPASPREAVETWLKVPGGRISNLTIKRRQELADDVVLRIFESTQRKHPTIEVQDRGIGLTPAQMPGTILSLGEGNKIDKAYLAGAYGQGGSTALAFSPRGCLFVSRKQKELLTDGDPDVVAVTFARYNDLDPEKNKNGRYEYLVQPNNEIASVSPKEAGMPDCGTSVVHFEMHIPQYSARLTQLTGSLWWLLQNTLFDPVLPLWAEERRASMLDKASKGEKTKERDARTIAGNFTRLSDDKKDRVEHQDSIDVHVPFAPGDTTVKVNYWVIRQDPDAPSAQPIDAYVDPYKPVTYTFFGQTHGTDERRFTSERLQLPYLAKFLIIQVELDNLTAQARRELLSTTRDRLKQLSFFEVMRECIRTALSEDPELVRLHDERKERVLSRHSESEQNKMRERFARLMEKFKAGIDTNAKAKGATDKGRRESEPSGSREPLPALPTKDKPTFIRIGNTQKQLLLRLDRHALIRLESDAPDGYLSSHVHAKLTLGSDPDGIVALESRSDFRGGRARMTVRPTARAKVGDSGTLTVFLFTPEEKQLTAKLTFKIEKPEEQPTGGSTSKAKVQVPAPIPVHRDEWKTFGWTDVDVAIVAEDDKDTRIYVNMDNRHLYRLLHGGKYQEVGVKRMSNNYLLYTAFYAWMKHVYESGQDLKLEGKELEDYQRAELDRVAQTVIHSMSAASRTEEED